MKVPPVKFGVNITIRECMVSDAEQVLFHTERVAKETNFLLSTPEEMTNFTKEYEEKWIISHSVNPNWLLLVAEEDGKVIGLLSFRTSERTRAAHRGLLGISIRQEYTNQGLGQMMIKILIQWVEHNKEIEKICLEVFSHNSTAIHVYKKLGFMEEGIRKRHVKFEDGTYADEMLMYRFV